MLKIKALFNPIDLTKGNVVKGIMVFTIPIFLSLFFQQLYYITDSIIVGKTLSEAEIAGISNASALTYFFTFFSFGAVAGFSVVVSKMFGAKNFKKIRESIFIQFFYLLLSRFSLRF